MVSSPILSESSENFKNAFSPLAIEVDSVEALSGLLVISRLGQAWSL